MPKIEVFRGLYSKDFPSFAANRAVTYGHSHIEDSAWMDWKFNQSPFGAAIVVLAKSDKGEVIACNAYGILNYIHNEKIVKLAMPYDTWVHKSFQGAGLFGDILKEIRHAALDNGIDGLLFFPNQESLNSLRRNDHWMELDANLSYLIKPKSITSILANPFDIKQSFIADRQEKTTHSFDFETPIANFDKNFLTVNISSEYLRWRFNHPTKNVYRKFSGVVSEIVVRHGSRGKLSEAQIIYIGKVIDMDNRKIRQEIVSTVKILLAEFDLVGLPISKKSDTYALFKSLGFFAFPSRTNVFVQTLSENLGDSYNNLCLSGVDFHTY